MSAIITGATGMVGEGVLHECLEHSDVERVLVLGRKPCGVTHPKLTEIVLPDLFDLSSIEARLDGYNACFYCLGISSAGMNEAEYSRITHDLTLYVAGLLARINSEMVFCYVTAGGTDRTEQGKSMWARVKGRTENQLLQLPFKRAYMFRPGYIHPTKGLRNTHRYYVAFSWLYPALRRFMPKHVITLSELGKAMINVVNKDYDTSILESKDMAKVAQK
ncbi:MAG: epimerase [Gorillibacterium sp.]|nr:epimerase [Gorillibacterium sp.]